MPPKIQFSRTDVLQTAFLITRTQGIDAVNARAVAKTLGCSTQPIFRAFRSMEEVRVEMLRLAMDRYASYIAGSAALSSMPYLGTGMAYIRFAQEEPELFKLLFMRDRVADGTINHSEDQTLDYVISLVMNGTGLSRMQALLFHRHLWIYTHGLATMVATKFLTLENEEVINLLTDEYYAIRALFHLPSGKDKSDLPES